MSEKLDLLQFRTSGLVGCLQSGDQHRGSQGKSAQSSLCPLHGGCCIFVHQIITDICYVPGPA